MDYQKIAAEFHALESDVEKWEWVRKNQGSGVIIMLDNDDTFGVFPENRYDDAAPTLQFSWYIGNSAGVEQLLTAMGIQCEGV